MKPQAVTSISEGLLQSEDGAQNRTEITMENVANRNLHLHLHYRESYRDLPRREYRRTRTMNSDDTSKYATDDRRRSLSAAFSRTLDYEDQTSETRTLRQAANAFAQLMTGNPFTDEERNTKTEERPSPKSHRTFTAGNGSSWDKSVQAVVDSVNDMANYAAGIRDHPNAEPSTRTTAPAHLIQATKERMMTLHPLLMPPEDKLIPAHRLASIYFTAVLDPCDIPEFKAEYMYNDGRRSCILLTFKSVHDADRLKELWDSADRENTRAPELAKVLLYRGNTSAKPVDASFRDAAFEELASFKLMPYAMV